MCPMRETIVDIVHDGPRLVLGGEFDVRSTFEVRSALRDHLEGSEVDVVVDLTALKVLAAATFWAQREGRHITLRGAGPSVRRMLHKSHLIKVVDLERVGVGA